MRILGTFTGKLHWKEFTKIYDKGPDLGEGATGDSTKQK
jgi:hypothetical protein